MASHKFDPAEISKLENPERFKWLNPESVAYLFDLSGDEVLVEYGCGTGFYSIPLARRVPRGKVIGVDISQELLDFFASKLLALPASGNNVELILAEGTTTPIPEAGADGILAINLMHELEGEWGVLDEMHRILSPSGTLVVLDWLAIERPAGPPIDHCLEPGRALQLLDDAGFALVREPTSASETFPYHFVYILGKK